MESIYLSGGFNSGSYIKNIIKSNKEKFLKNYITKLKEISKNNIKTIYTLNKSIKYKIKVFNIKNIINFYYRKKSYYKFNYFI